MFNVNQMSAAEFKFIQTYVTALRKDYWLVKSTIELMKPDQLAVKDIVTAARLAQDMQKMHEQFDVAASHIAATKKFVRRKALPQRPTLDELGELFALSFFKVVTTIKEGKKSIASKDDGWFSGDPYEWQNVFDSIQKNPPFNSVLTDCLKVLAKMFPEMKHLKDFYAGDIPLYDTPLNFWPGKTPMYDETEEDDDDWYDT